MATIVSRVYFENFRSFRKEAVDTIGDIVPIIGLNSAGKSNVLRALDLFFNDSIEGAPLDFYRDLSSHLPDKRKRLIGVGVELNYPHDWGLKGNQEFFRSNGIEDKVAVYKEWSFSRMGVLQCEVSFGQDLGQLSRADFEQETALTALVRSIRYHYVTNHVRPADKVSEIISSLRPEILKTWKSKYKDSGAFLDHLATTADQLFEPVSKSVSKGISGLTVSAAVPQDIVDLAFDLGMNAIANNDYVHDLTLEGSGAQSFTLLHFLELQHNAARRRSWGWTQASIWGFEEPESFLHSGLRTRFARDLREYSQDERKQTFLTTHDDDFVRESSSAVVVYPGAPGGTGSTMESKPSRDALAESSRARITSYRHPLATFPDEPLVIVEGKTDKMYLASALEAAGIRPRWRLIAPDEDLEAKTSGQALQSYLKMNQSALGARAYKAFLIALRDWEDSTKKVGELTKALEVHPYSYAVNCPANLSNPDLGERFVGIERFLPTSLITSIADPAKLDKNMSTGVLSISRDYLESIKPRLVSEVFNDRHAAGPYLENLAKWIDNQVEQQLSTVPFDQFF